MWTVSSCGHSAGSPAERRCSRRPIELRIAIAGPVASVAFRGRVRLSAFALSALGASALVVTTFLWLAEMNVVLALFNLLPASLSMEDEYCAAGLWHHWTTACERQTQRWASAVLRHDAHRARRLRFLFSRRLRSWHMLALIGWFILGSSRQERGAVRIVRSMDARRRRDAPGRRESPGLRHTRDLLEQYMRRTPRSLPACGLQWRDRWTRELGPAGPCFDRATGAPRGQSDIAWQWRVSLPERPGRCTRSCCRSALVCTEPLCARIRGRTACRTVDASRHRAGLAFGRRYFRRQSNEPWRQPPAGSCSYKSSAATPAVNADTHVRSTLSRI